MHFRNYFLLLLSFCLFSHVWAGIPRIRFTEKAPFTADMQMRTGCWDHADEMIRFVTREKYDVAVYPSVVRALFDQQNLYIAFRGYDDPQGQKSNPSGDYSLNNNFELFLQPESGGKYLRFIIDDCGSRGANIVKAAIQLPEIKTRVFRKKDYWEANLLIPFSVLKMSSPAAARTIRIGMMRRNISTWKKDQIEVSAYTPLDWNYHIPERWADITFTRQAGPARKVAGPAHGNRINLNPNPDFLKPVYLKSYQKQHVSHMETAAMSGKWIVRATGNVYDFMQINPEVEPDTDYTLVVRARKFGDDGSLRIIQFKRNSNGRTITHSPYVVSTLSLSPEFHEYFLPLRTPKEPFCGISLYKLGERSPACGVDIASIRLYKGKISTFEIRKVSPSGVLKPVPGTSVSMPANLFGYKARRMKVLALVTYRRARLREPLEIFAGMNVDCDALCITGKKQDIYQTFGDPGKIEKTLLAGGYDLFMIGAETAKGIGEKLSGIIMDQVRKGAGLWYGNNSGSNDFTPLLQKAGTVSAAGTYAAGYYPEGMFRSLDQPEAHQSMKIGTYGKGRVIQMFAPKYPLHFKLRLAAQDCGVAEFPFWRYTDAWLAHLAYYAAAFDDIRLENISMTDSGSVRFTAGKAPDGTAIRWAVIDKNGTEVRRGSTVIHKGTAEITALNLTGSGRHLLYAHMTGTDNRVLDYGLTTFTRPGPMLADFKADRDSYLSSQTAGFQISVMDFRPGQQLVWELLDFSGRILVRKACRAEQTNRIAMPLSSMYTNMGRLRISLLDGNKHLLDCRYEPVFVRNLDMDRVWNDYTPAVWPAGYSTMESLPDIDAQLEKIGIRHYILPNGGYPTVLRSGMSVGASFWGGGTVFCGWPQKSSVRAQQFNTGASRRELASSVIKSAARTVRYGVIHSSVCDEPNLSSLGRADELDAHPENLQEYRRRMQKKYRTIENYNRRHQTSHPNFESIGPTLIKDAREQKKFAEFIEWRNFNVDRWCEAIKIIADNGRKSDPQAKLSLYNSFGQGAFSGNDYWKLYTKAGLTMTHEYSSMIYFSENPLANFDEFHRSFRPDMRMWGFTGYFYSKERAFFMPWWFAAHRYGGFTWFAVDCWNYNLIDVPSYALTVNARNLMQALDQSNLLRGLGKVTLDFPWRKNDAAIYYSHDSMLLSFALGKEKNNGEIHVSGPLHDYFHSRQGIYYLLEELLWQYDFVAPEQVIGGKLNSFKILFMPRILTLSDQEVAALKKFLSRGGKIVADGMPGCYDELGVRRAVPPFSENEITLIGKNFNQRDPKQKATILALLKQQKSAPVLECDDIVSFSGREAMHFTDGDMNLYMILRMLGRSDDSRKQTFRFPRKAHLYDLRKQKYLGLKDSLTLAVPYGEAAVIGHYPYKVDGISIRMNNKVQAGSDLTADIAVRISETLPGISPRAQRHVFHIEVLNPEGRGRFHMKRNVSAPAGAYSLKFPMAFNDPKGSWTLRVTDAMTGVTEYRKFTLR